MPWRGAGTQLKHAPPEDSSSVFWHPFAAGCAFTCEDVRGCNRTAVPGVPLACSTSVVQRAACPQRPVEPASPVQSTAVPGCGRFKSCAGAVGTRRQRRHPGAACGCSTGRGGRPGAPRSSNTSVSQPAAPSDHQGGAKGAGALSRCNNRPSPTPRDTTGQYTTGCSPQRSRLRRVTASAVEGPHSQLTPQTLTAPVHPTPATMMLKLALVALLAAVACQQAAAFSVGRASFYGKDGWSIHHGSCGYGYLDENAGTGWDVAAASDKNGDYSNSCGRCKEVRCKPMTFRDGYGASLDRNGACFDQEASVVVTITDTCPCYYPGNMYSNKRWCCGDMYHLDMSLWSFEKLADTKYGVIAIEQRDVACNYRPNKPARNPWGQRSGPDRGPPGNWNPSQDKRPYNQNNGRRLLSATKA